MGAHIEKELVTGVSMHNGRIYGNQIQITNGIISVYTSQYAYAVLTNAGVYVYDNSFKQIGFKADNDGILSISANPNTPRIAYGTDTSFFNVINQDGSTPWYKIHASVAKGILVTTIDDTAFSVSSSQTNGLSIMLAKATMNTSGSLTTMGNFSHLLTSTSAKVQTFMAFTRDNTQFVQATSQNRIAVMSTSGIVLDSQTLEIEGNIVSTTVSDNYVYVATDSEKLYALTFDATAGSQTARYAIVSGTDLSVKNMKTYSSRVIVSTNDGLVISFDEKLTSSNVLASYSNLVVELCLNLSSNQLICFQQNGNVEKISLGRV